MTTTKMVHVEGAEHGQPKTRAVRDIKVSVTDALSPQKMIIILQISLWMLVVLLVLQRTKPNPPCCHLDVWKLEDSHPVTSQVMDLV